jgi:hypothetical protein
MSVPDDNILRRNLVARALLNYAINAAIADLNAQIRIHSGVAQTKVAMQNSVRQQDPR